MEDTQVNALMGIEMVLGPLFVLECVMMLYHHDPKKTFEGIIQDCHSIRVIVKDLERNNSELPQSICVILVMQKL